MQPIQGLQVQVKVCQDSAPWLYMTVIPYTNTIYSKDPAVSEKLL